MTPQNGLLATIGALAIGWYLFCILYVGFKPEPAPATKAANEKLTGEDDGFRQFTASSVTTLAGTLATFVGMVLGFSQVSAQPNANPDQLPAGAKLTVFQLVAASVYVLSLVIALIIWWNQIHHGVPCDPSIVNLGKSFIGLVGGALAVMVNVK